MKENENENETGGFTYFILLIGGGLSFHNHCPQRHFPSKAVVFQQFLVRSGKQAGDIAKGNDQWLRRISMLDFFEQINTNTNLTLTAEPTAWEVLRLIVILTSV